MTRTYMDTEAMHVPPADPPPLTPWGIVACHYGFRVELPPLSRREPKFKQPWELQ